PLIQPTREYLDKLTIPDIEICCSESDIQITKCVFTFDNWTLTTFDNCTKFIKRSPRIKDNIYCYLFENFENNDAYFESNKTYSFGNPDINLTGPW
ncbi:1279_t:CDS:2, partial [Dentiscutata heterogama]